VKGRLLTLGPTFIKLGQLMSTRVDIVPKEYVEECASLQDRVPGFSGERARRVLEKELGRPVEDVFDRFDEVPIAAASLGQVHRAVLGGREVAVKIQRSGLRELFDVDLKNLRVLAVLLDKMDPKNDGARRNWVSIYEESAKLLYEEIDYAAEGRNADRFRENFADTEWIKVPDVYWEHTTSRVLTMEYVPGIKINDYAAIEAAGIDRAVLARRSAESYLTQLLRHGYFHTDPHCGNISCDAAYGGRLIVYDYGMMSAFPPHIRDGLVDVVFGVYEGSAKEICDAMTKMGVLAPGADRVTVEKVGRYFLGLFRSNVGNENRKKTKEEKRAEMIRRLDNVGEDLLAVSEDECFNFPPVFTFVFRAFTTLEGIGKGLDPRYDLTLIAGPYLKELIDLKDGSAAATAVKQFRKRVGWRAEDISSLVTAPRKTAYIESTLRRMESGDLRLRVRVLESERAFKRLTLMQENMALALAAATFSNMAVALMARAEEFAVQAKLVWLIASLFAFRLVVGLARQRALDRRLDKYTRRTQ
jgi:predicted unusual protein kinase regulating ubiquinone biosynthesis (AarF/ABC1/UbiB family)